MHKNTLISWGHFPIADLALHRNRGMELTYIHRGRIEWLVGDRIEIVQQGDIFFTLPWQIHGSLVLQQPENLVWHLLFRLPGNNNSAKRSFQWPSELGFSTREATLLSRTFCSQHKHAWSANAQIRTLFPWMIEAFESKNTLELSKGWSFLRIILVELFNLMGKQQTSTPGLLDSERRVGIFLEKLKMHCDDEWTLESMAESCGIQRTRFANLVRKQTAFSPMAYLMRVRVDKACSLLRKKNPNITDIAFECGFSSSQYFANVFRKCMGLSPTEYNLHHPQLYQLNKPLAQIPWRTIEEERERMRRFKALQNKT
jgi:AraC-like DNA-binding protein